MKFNTKFKSGISSLIIFVLIIYHILIAALFFLPLILYKDITTRFAFILLIFNALYLYPLIFNTYYTLEDDHLFIYQWPVARYKIKYENIFEITDVLPEGIKKVKKYSLSKPIIYVGYFVYSVDKDTKKAIKTKHYIQISPKDMDLFLIKMGGKFKRARDLAAKLEEEHKQKNVEHLKKKSIADKLRKEKEEQNKSVDVVVKTKAKTDVTATIETEENK